MNKYVGLLFKAVIGCAIGCFIFSPFLKSKMPGCDRVGFGEKIGSHNFFDYDVILRLHASIEILRSRFFVNVA